MSTSPAFPAPRGDADQPVADLSKAPLPTERTLRRRKNLAVQAVRYAVFNARMLKILVKGD
ncbi:MAG TPA: hypothetical protein PLP61_03095 [Nocardioides sp.]|uniref:hypothetical protein n=1 Tax=Nocardioides sp. TaxID=35761 RepID=UPI002BFE3426|nr:hypothetical protein [Nocardioides sp.]HQR26004.1 hypothetical protein [Nocardioides sp.]